MTRGGKREGAGRKSRGLPTGKISAYIQDKELLKNIAEELNIPVVELLHQILKHNNFDLLIEDLKSSEDLKQWNIK